MEDYYKDGFNEGYGNGHLNNGHDFPDSDGDRYDYERGREDGERRRSYDDYSEW
jgi:hypothetical protein